MIGYVEQLADYFNGRKPKKAQSIPASLFYRKNEKMGISELSFELFPLSEKHSLNFRVGDHPLQDGSVISDHVQQELQEVSVDCFISNYPIRPLENISEVRFGDDFATKEVRPSVQNYALQKFNEVLELAKKKEPVRLVCSLGVYQKMVITSVEYERDSKTGSGIPFTMKLREVKIVKLKSTNALYPFNPSSMESERDKLIAQMKALGKTSTEIQDVKTMIELENVEVLQ